MEAFITVLCIIFFNVILRAGAILLGFLFRIFKRPTIRIIGKNFTKEEQPMLWGFVNYLCRSCKVQPPENIVLGINPNFFVTENKLIVDEEEITGKTLYMSLPFLRVMSLAEVKSVLGHELGHLQAGDTSSLKSVFLSLKKSREDELRADSFSAENFGNINLATALVKVHAFSSRWGFVEDKMLEHLSSQKTLRNTSHYFFNLIGSTDKSFFTKKLLDYHIEHPTDTHPSLKTRLENLNVPHSEENLKLILDVKDEKQFKHIKDLEKIEEALTIDENKKLMLLAHLYSHVKNEEKFSETKTEEERSFNSISEIIRKSLIYTMASDGDVDDSEKATLFAIYTRITGQEIDILEFVSEVNSITFWSDTLFKMIEQFDFTEELKEKIFLGVLLVVKADSKIHTSELHCINKFIVALKYPKDKAEALKNKILHDKLSIPA